MGRSVNHANKSLIKSWNFLPHFSIKIGFKRFYTPDIESEYLRKFNDQRSKKTYEECLKSADGFRSMHVEPIVLSKLPAPSGRLIVIIEFKKPVGVQVFVPRSTIVEENKKRTVVKIIAKSNRRNIIYKYKYYNYDEVEASLPFRNW